MEGSQITGGSDLVRGQPALQTDKERVYKIEKIDLTLNGLLLLHERVVYI